MPQNYNGTPPSQAMPSASLNGNGTEHSTTPEDLQSQGAAAPGVPLELSWYNAQGSIIGLSLLNFILRILTLGIYHFWGKTEVRKRIWAASRLQGEPLEYTGTGWELFIGFVIVFFLVILPLAILSFSFQIFLTQKTAALLTLPLYGIIFFLIGMGSYRAKRYRLSRTRWRGIRGSLTGGKSFKYALLYVGTGLLIPMTMGWIIPWRESVLQRFMTNETKFGNRPLTFTGNAGPLYKRYWAVWLAGVTAYFGGFAIFFWYFWDRFSRAQRGVPISFDNSEKMVIAGIVLAGILFFALIKAWYSAGLINYFASQTWYGRARFKGNATATSLIWLTFTNFLISLLSLGALAPVAQSRFMRYYMTRLDFDGNVPLERVGQNEEAMVTRGEGLATAFDIDAFG